MQMWAHQGNGGGGLGLVASGQGAGCRPGSLLVLGHLLRRGPCAPVSGLGPSRVRRDEASASVRTSGPQRLPRLSGQEPPPSTGSSAAGHPDPVSIYQWPFHY